MRRVSIAINLFAEWTKRFARENGFNREAKIFAETKRQFQTWVEITTLYVPHSLIVDIKRVSKRATAETALGTQDGDSIEQCSPAPRIGIRVVCHAQIVVLVQYIVKYIFKAGGEHPGVRVNALILEGMLGSLNR